MKEFWQTIYGDHIGPQSRLAIFTGQDSRTCFCENIEQAMQYAQSKSRSHDVYYGLGLIKGQPRGRGRKQDVAAIGALWADIDLMSEAHNEDNLPETLAEVEELLDSVDLAPSAIVHSGYGVHAYWFLAKPLVIENDTQRQRAERLTKGWHGRICQQARQFGWSMPNLGDLTRILRVPGTWNYKVPEKPLKVELARFDPQCRYEVETIERLLPEKVETPAVQADCQVNLRSDAQPPADKLVELITCSDKFRQTWQRERTDLADQSQSGYDLSLATIAAKSGWADQEIADLIIAARCKHGDKPEKALREDYILRTLTLAREGIEADSFDDVDISGVVAKMSDNIIEIPICTKIINPWNKVNNDDIEDVLAGTMLGEMCAVFRSVTTPELPLEAALLKAITLSGCALSCKNTAVDLRQPLYQFIQTGAPLARLCIDTAGGQVANIYSILIGNSSSGKDIGRLLNHIAKARKWLLPGRASAEGLADSLMDRPNGLLLISEFQDWLDSKHWLNKSVSFLTDAFDAGCFEYGLSTRGGQGKRVADYCYPNILANIQPDIFESAVKRTDITSGFLARFIICNMPTFFGDPTNFNLLECLRKLDNALNAFEIKQGQVKVPDDYLRHLSDMFRKHSPEKLHANWRRLVLGYGPRFASMLSVTRDNAFRDTVELTDRCWEGAEKLILWFFTHAEKALSDVEEDDKVKRDREKLYQKLFDIIRKKDEGEGVTTRDISTHGIWGTTAKERQEGLQELIERGVITSHAGRYRILSTPVGWDR